MTATQASNQDTERRRIAPEDPPAVLLELDERDFYNLVDRDVRGRLEAKLARKLRDPLVVERWYQTLLRMKKTVEGTIAAKTSETRGQRIELETFGTLSTWRGPDVVSVEHFQNPREKAAEIHFAYLAWRAGSIRFKVGVEERLTEVSWRRKLVVSNLILSVAQVERNQFADEVQRLRTAIEVHHSEIDRDDVTEQDEALWAVVPWLDAD